MQEIRERFSSKKNSNAIETRRQTQLATVRFVSESHKRSISTNANTSSSSSSSKLIRQDSSVSRSSVPVRAIVHDSSWSSSSSKRSNFGSSGGSNGGLYNGNANKKPAVSQGMKKVNKLLKSHRR